MKTYKCISPFFLDIKDEKTGQVTFTWVKCDVLWEDTGKSVYASQHTLYNSEFGYISATPDGLKKHFKEVKKSCMK